MILNYLRMLSKRDRCLVLWCCLFSMYIITMHTCTHSLPPQDERLGLVRHGWLSTTSIVPCWWLFGFLFPWHASFCGSWFHIGIKFHDPQESKWEKPWVLPWSPGPPGKREKAWWKSKKCEKAFWFFCILCRFQSYVYIIVDTLI